MKFLKITASALLLFSLSNSYAQDDLMKELDGSNPNEKQVETAAFKGLQICNMQSTKLPVKGEFYFLVSHRFGDLSNGINNFFGLDNALTKLSGIYGVTNWLSLGASRNTYLKTYELAAKYRFANQVKDGFPVTIAGYNTVDITSDKFTELSGLKFENRLAYSTQLLVSRKFNENFSAQLTPMFIHKNLYDELADQKNLFLLGAGARYKLSKRISLNMDYSVRLIEDEVKSPYYNPLSVGVDIETGGHVFQLLLSNTQKMNDVSMYTTADGCGFNKGIYFGFNMYRVF